MWKDALAVCRKEGGDLASIPNIEEQSFIISQLGYCKFDKCPFLLQFLLVHSCQTYCKKMGLWLKISETVLYNIFNISMYT